MNITYIDHFLDDFINYASKLVLQTCIQHLNAKKSSLSNHKESQIIAVITALTSVCKSSFNI